MQQVILRQAAVNADYRSKDEMSIAAGAADPQAARNTYTWIGWPP